MSQFDFGNIDPYVVDGVQLASMLNQWRDAIYSWHRGPTRPPYSVEGMLWVNDSAGDTSWQVFAYLGATAGDVLLWSYDTTTGNFTLNASQMTATILTAQAATNPSVRWNATGNAADAKAWRAITKPDGTLHFGAFNDAGAEIGAGITMTRDGKLVADLSGSSGIPSPLVVGPTPPASPQPNQMWWNSDNSATGGGRLYLWFVDVDTSQWVPTSPPLGITWVAPPTSDLSGAGFATGTNFWAGGDTAMQITNGIQLFSRNFTASDATHPIEVDAQIWIQATNSTAGHAVLGLFVDGAVNAIAQGFTTAQVGSANNIHLYWQGALAAGPHTFTLRLGSLNTSGVYTNMSDAGHTGGGAQKNTMVVREVGVGAAGPQGPPGPAQIARTYDEYTSAVGITAQISSADVIPLATAGTQILSRTIAVAAGQRVRARFQGMWSAGLNQSAVAILTRSGSANALRATFNTIGATQYGGLLLLEYEDAPGAGNFTYGINVGPNTASTIYMNASGGTRVFGGAAAATLMLETFNP
jgi:hypothetical protein